MSYSMKVTEAYFHSNIHTLLKVLGFNIESVAIRKDEIEASIFLINRIGEMLKEQGIRK